METDFIELMQAFQKTGNRMNKLNESIVGFKDILESLRQEMDQLIDLVELENIISLAQDTTQILNEVQTQYDVMNGTYEKLLTLEEIRNDNTEQIKQLKQLMNDEFLSTNQQINSQFEIILAQLNSLKSNDLMSSSLHSKKACMTKAHCYLKDDFNHQLIIQSNESNEKMVIESFSAGKFQKYKQQLFIQNEINQTLYLCDGQDLTLIKEEVSSNFHIIDFEIYDLVHNVLQKTNMMTHKTTILFKEVTDFEIQGYMLLIKENESYKYINLNDINC